jgi:putative chitinase
MALSVTAAQLRAIGGRGVLQAEELARTYNEHAPRYGLDVERRAAHFLAQLAHESGGFRYYKEIWGPTPAQRRYEGRLDLGNTQPRDGSKFRGYGLIQLTGRANVAAFTQWCRERYPDCPDFVETPDKLAVLPWALLAAFWFWDTRGLNALADRDDLVGITKRINGGQNGLADRRYRYGLAARALVSDNPPASPRAPTDPERETLRKGAKGDAVRELQRLLCLEDDGHFGPVTHNAVVEFQREAGLLPDGVVGGLTWAQLTKVE